MSSNLEFSATEVREVMIKIFPHRKLVLSQFTFFATSGVGTPSGESFRRGRRCYVLEDLLPIVCVLALKERGISLKTLGIIPTVLREKAHTILTRNEKCWVVGFGSDVEVCTAENPGGTLLDRFLAQDAPEQLFWRFDVSSMADELLQAASEDIAQQIAVAA